ncbi:hypothetical protein OAK75_02725 [Bacteriovoracales bacterium]|nr:hypothetical protein [Bacteriovoracales bacterium]
MKNLRKTKCPKEISQVLLKAQQSDVVFIIWFSKKGLSFIKTGALRKILKIDLQIEIHDYSLRNSFIEEEDISFGEFIYFRSSFLGLTFKASFISNADDNCFWVKTPQLALLNEKRKYPRKYLNCFNWKATSFNLTYEDSTLPDNEGSYEAPLVENFTDENERAVAPADENDTQADLFLENELLKNNLHEYKDPPKKSFDLNKPLKGVIIEISKNGATLLVSKPPYLSFEKHRILHFHFIEGINIPPNLKAEIRSLRKGKIGYQSHNEEKFLQIGLQFNSLVNY